MCVCVSPFQRACLLYKTVVATVTWKMSRWPFQKAIAQEVDNLQTQMIAMILPCVPMLHESPDHFFRRRRRNALNLANHVGLWSLLWAKRVVDWDSHIRRGLERSHFCALIVVYHDAAWLQEQRSNFVNANRNSIFAGRTSTRLNLGRPQTRWADGVMLAAHIFGTRSTNLRGQNATTVSTRIREALTFITAWVSDVVHSSS